MNPDCSLTKAVEDVSKRADAHTEALREKERMLSSLQVHLYLQFTMGLQPLFLTINDCNVFVPPYRRSLCQMLR